MPMPRKEEIQHSILTVSGAEKFFSLIRKALQPGRFMSSEYKSSAASARRCILERYYDLIVINAPLPDESGVEFAIDTAGRLSASLLLVVPSDIYEDVLERVTDYGILVIAKPFPPIRVSHAIRFLTAQQDQVRRLEQAVQAARDKAEEIRLIDKAKFLLIEYRYMTEDAAHRYIGKQAMDHGVSRRRIAQEIVEEYE